MIIRLKQLFEYLVLVGLFEQCLATRRLDSHLDSGVTKACLEVLINFFFRTLAELDFLRYLNWYDLPRILSVFWVRPMGLPENLG